MIAIVDFYVKSFGEYKEWLIRHLALNPESPAPVESPYFTKEQIMELFPKTLRKIEETKEDGLVKSWAVLLHKK